MLTFQEILEQNGIEFIDALMNNYLVVYGKKNCSVLSFMRCGEELKFFKGNDKEEITPLNYALHTYFEDGINYIRRASSIFFREFPENWLFKMNYYPKVSSDVNVVNPNDELLEISAIVSDSGNIMKEESMLSSWAERLNVGYVKPVFSGFLNEFQKSKLYAYIKEPVLNAQVSFSSYIMDILNPNLRSDSVEGYYFNFYKNGSKKATALKLIDPMIAALSKKTSGYEVKKNSNTSELVLLNFVCWLKGVDLNKYKVDGDDDDSRYLDLICKLFNDYIEAESAIYKSYIKESFNLINFDKITNDKTRELLKSHPQYQEPFQIIAGSFKVQKDVAYVNPTSLMNTEIVNSFNNEVERIMQKVSVSNIPQKETNPSKPQEVKDETGGDKSEKFLTFIDFISQDKDSDYVKSMEKEKDEKSEKESDEKGNGSKKDGDKDTKKSEKSGDEKKEDEKKEKDTDEKSEDEKSEKSEKKSDEKEESDQSDEKKDVEKKEDEKKEKDTDEKSEEDNKDEDADEKGDEANDENTDGDGGNDDSEKSDDSGDAGNDSGSDASGGGEETKKNDKKNNKKEKKDDSGSSFSL